MLFFAQSGVFVWSLSANNESQRNDSVPINNLLLVSKVYVDLYSASTPLTRSDMDHTVWTVLPANNTISAFTPVTEHHRPLAGTHCAYPLRDGQAELTRVVG